MTERDSREIYPARRGVYPPGRVVIVVIPTYGPEEPAGQRPIGGSEAVTTTGFGSRERPLKVVMEHDKVVNAYRRSGAPPHDFVVNGSRLSRPRHDYQNRSREPRYTHPPATTKIVHDYHDFLPAVDHPPAREYLAAGTPCDHQDAA